MNEQVETQRVYPPNLWIKTGIICVLWAAAFIPVYPMLWETWMEDSNNSHGVLVPLISGFLIWQKRDKLGETRPNGSKWGVLLLFVSLIVYILTLAGQVAVAQRAMIVVSLIGLVIFIFGIHIFRLVAFPLLYLFFMIPVPDAIYGLIAFDQLLITDAILSIGKRTVSSVLRVMGLREEKRFTNFHRVLYRAK